MFTSCLPTSSEKLPTFVGSSWIDSAAIYEIFTLTFRHGTKPGKTSFHHYGNIRGIREKIEYIQALGVDAVWLTPIYDSPLKDGFGYNVRDYQKIHPVFGTEEEFTLLVSELHARGLKLLLDLVINHTSDQHEWFQLSKQSRSNRYADYYVWADPRYDGQGNRLPPNNWLSMDINNPSAWEWVEERGQYYLHSFNRTMPDLNINNEVVQDELVAILDFWLEKGVDGFRIDAAPHMGHDPKLRDNPFDPHRIGGGYHSQIQLYTTQQQSGVDLLRKLKKHAGQYRKSLPTQPHIIYTPALLGEVIADLNFAKRLLSEQAVDAVYTGRLCGNLFDFKSIVQDTYRARFSNFRLNWAMSNHDMPRVLDRTMGHQAQPEHARLYLAMLVTLPGSISLFQGEELGLRQGFLAETLEPENDPLGLAMSFMTESDSSRAGLPWQDQANRLLWMKPPTVNVDKYPEAQALDENSTLRHAQMLLRLRNQYKALKSLSAPLFIDCYDPAVLCYLRANPNYMEQMICVFNFDTYSKQMWFTGQDLLGETRTYQLDCKGLNYAFLPNPCITQIRCSRIETIHYLNQDEAVCY